MAEAVEDAFRYDRLVLASITYDAGILPVMETFINKLKAKNYQNRKIALIENGSWAPMAAKLMREKLDGMKNITVLEKTVTVKSAVGSDTVNEIKALAEELLK